MSIGKNPAKNLLISKNRGSVLAHRFSEMILLYAHDIVCFARFRLRLLTVRVTKRNGRDADKGIGQPPLLEQRLTFIGLKDLFGAVYPAGIESNRVSGV